MAQLITVLVAAFLFLVESQASDVADRSGLQGFLSKDMPTGSDVPRSSMNDYDKFITPNLNHVNHGNGAQALSGHNNLAGPGPSMGVSTFTIVDDKPVPHPTRQDFNPPTIADREAKQAVQKLLTDDSSNPITLSAIGIGLLSLATMLGVRLRRGLQPATVLASSDGLGPVMLMNTVSTLGDNVMEMKTQDPSINDSAAVLETRPTHKVNSSRVSWGQRSSQNSHPLGAASYGLEPSATAPRRTVLSTVGAPAALAFANLIAPKAAVAEGLQEISVPFGSSAKDGSALARATFSVPSDWVKLSGDAGDGRALALYADPNNADINAFALITPIRGDYTSLGSFGPVEVVQDTVMPKAPDINYEVLKAEDAKGKYVYEYVVEVPGQPKRHLLTIFLVASDCIVTFNFQAKQADYNGEVPGLAKSISASFKTGKI